MRAEFGPCDVCAVFERAESVPAIFARFRADICEDSSVRNSVHMVLHLYYDLTGRGGAKSARARARVRTTAQARSSTTFVPHKDDFSGGALKARAHATAEHRLQKDGLYGAHKGTRLRVIGAGFGLWVPKPWPKPCPRALRPSPPPQHSTRRLHLHQKRHSCAHVCAHLWFPACEHSTRHRRLRRILEASWRTEHRDARTSLV